jgi:hypothetical protein
VSLRTSPNVQREPSLWPAALIIVIPVLLIGAMLYATRYLGSSDSRPVHFHSYGVVHTRLGDATVGCGGDLTSTCDGEVGLEFARRTPELRAYFAPALFHLYDPVFFDRLARGLAGSPPPGTQWTALSMP